MVTVLKVSRIRDMATVQKARAVRAVVTPGAIIALIH
jgi:hypothetical protein